MAIRVVFADVNGTLFNDWKACHFGMEAIFVCFSKKPPTLEEYVRLVGGGGDFYSYYSDHGIFASRDELYEIFLPAYVEYQLRLDIFYGVPESLKKMSEMGIRLHLITSGSMDFIKPLLKIANLHSYFDGEWYHTHNKQVTIEDVLSVFKYNKHECVMVGDLPSDIKFAKAAGIKAIAFLNEDVPKDMFEDIHDMDYATPHWSAVVDYILSL